VIAGVVSRTGETVYAGTFFESKNQDEMKPRARTLRSFPDHVFALWST
jgi:hypothetical protein